MRDDALVDIGAHEAYWLRFLFADGSISKVGVIQLRIAIVDLPSETVAGYVCKPSVKLTICSRRLGHDDSWTNSLSFWNQWVWPRR